MRRNYISPEFIYEKVYGTFNMKEESSFFGSKMMSIDNEILIGNESIVYYQNNNGEQVNYDSERFLSPIVFNTVDLKQKSHTIYQDNSQTDYQKLNNTKWIIDINIKSILVDYIYSTIKKWRTFDGVYNNMVINNNINSSIKDYINLNLLGRYKFSKIEFYIDSINLSKSNSLQYLNIFDSSIESSNLLYSKIESTISSNESSLKIKFNQPDPSSQFAFKYYYNLFFVKI